MSLIRPEDLLTANKNLKYFGGKYTARFILWFLRFSRLDKDYTTYQDLSGPDFLNKIIELYGLKYEILAEDIKKIPEKGPFIIISNHPTGGAEGILLIKLFSDKRPDFKFLTNFLLQKIDTLKQFFLPVNPFENRKDIQSSMAGIKNALEHIRSGAPLGIFPAGEVSAYQKGKREITDKEWLEVVVKLIRKAQVPVIPVFVEARNSSLFYFLGKINPLLRTIKLPSELLNKKNQLIKIRVGYPISVNEQNLFTDIKEYSDFLRMKTYTLGRRIKNKNLLCVNSKEEALIREVPQSLIISEVNKLTEKNLLFSLENYKVFHAKSEMIPNTLKEIGRLREITYREVGEGTGKSIDIDKYDSWYTHLFIWDDEANCIVGAYRMGKGKELLEQFGIKGFYLQSLFKFNEKIFPTLEKSIELGRSFIRKEYQRKTLSLFLLWKGILYFLVKNPEYRYLIGPVSISDAFSDFSKGLIIEFLKANCYNEELSKYLISRNAFKYNLADHIDINVFLKFMGSDINRLDKFIHDIEPEQRIPVLFKKYIKQNARIIGCNVDPKFNYCLDVVMLLDLKDVPSEVIESLSKESSDSVIAI
jgi:putative hemolysin